MLGLFPFLVGIRSNLVRHDVRVSMCVPWSPIALFGLAGLVLVLRSKEQGGVYVTDSPVSVDWVALLPRQWVVNIFAV